MSDMQDMLGKEMAEGIDTNVDIVFVIDATRSMEPLIEKVKNATLVFHDELTEELKEKKRIIKSLRVKAIWFRDFYFDGKYAYGESPFFILPEEREAFHDFVACIEAKGGYDDPESALEALTLAMRSDFVQDGEKKRHVIVLFTDEEAHRFEDRDSLMEEAAKLGCTLEQYPENMPGDYTEFTNAWAGNAEAQDALGTDGKATKLDQSGRRLVIFAPDAYPWTNMEMDWENVIRVNMEQGGSGEDLDMADVYPMIANSLA